jgi:Flp pilus assembly protein TadD, contains TPR repeats
MLDCELFGLNPGAHHLVNVLFHATNVILLFLLLLRMTSALWPAAIVAALFAWHPLHVESVAWIAERKDVLSTFFGLLALLAYARYAKGKKRASFWLSVLLFALALMAKPMLVTLPFVLLLLDYWPLQRFDRSTIHESRITFLKLVREKWPFFLLTLASCVVTYLAQRGDAVVALSKHPLGLRVANALVSYLNYLLKAIWPSNLAVIYPLPKQLPWMQVGVAAVVLFMISWLAWRAHGRRPYLLMGWLWFLGTLVPVIGLVQVGAAAMADRYTYFPLIGIFIAVVHTGRDWVIRFPGGAKISTVATGLVLAGCLAGTLLQLRHWKNSETLFTHTLAVTKNNYIAHEGLGVALALEGRPEDAMTEYRETLRIKPDSKATHYNLANLLNTLGQTDEALLHYREALRLNPKAPLTHLTLASLLVKLGRFDEAMQHYAEAARLAPTDPQPHAAMGVAYLFQGRDAEAVSSFRAALRLGADDVQTLMWLAHLLAADENAGIRNGTEAVALAERATNLTKMTKTKDPLVLDTLAMAYAETGRFDDAVRIIQEVINISTAAGDNDYVAELRTRLKLYQSNQPYRESFANPPRK